MSGEAGASHQSTYYQLFVGSGVIISVAAPPGEDPNPYVRDYFERENDPYQRWIAAAAPELDRLFERFTVEKRLPLAPLGADDAQIFGVILEDCEPLPDDPARRRRALDDARYQQRNGARFFAEHPARAVQVQLRWSPSHRFGTVDATVALTAQVKRSELNLLRDEVLKILTATRPPEAEG